MDVIVKILVAVVVLVVIGMLKPVLMSFYPPLGVIILIALFAALILWLMGKF